MVYEPCPIDETTNEDRILNNKFFMNVLSDDVGTFYHRHRSWGKHEVGPASIAQYTTEQRTLAYRYIRSLPLSKPVTWNLFDEKSRPPLNYCLCCAQQALPFTANALLRRHPNRSEHIRL